MIALVPLFEQRSNLPHTDAVWLSGVLCIIYDHDQSSKAWTQCFDGCDTKQSPFSCHGNRLIFLIMCAWLVLMGLVISRVPRLKHCGMWLSSASWDLFFWVGRYQCYLPCRWIAGRLECCSILWFMVRCHLMGETTRTSSAKSAMVNTKNRPSRQVQAIL